MPFTVIMPNNLFQYDDVPISNCGEKTLPTADRRHRPKPVEARDVADAITVALTQAGHEFHKYPLVGLEALTGQDVAEIYTHYLGRNPLYR
jgi:uncharacterized protein YbjT (DUF2867 family)